MRAPPAPTGPSSRGAVLPNVWPDPSVLQVPSFSFSSSLAFPLPFEAVDADCGWDRDDRVLPDPLNGAGPYRKEILVTVTMRNRNAYS